MCIASVQIPREWESKLIINFHNTDMTLFKLNKLYWFKSTNLNWTNWRVNNGERVRDCLIFSYFLAKPLDRKWNRHTHTDTQTTENRQFADIYHRSRNLYNKWIRIWSCPFTFNFIRSNCFQDKAAGTTTTKSKEIERLLLTKRLKRISVKIMNNFFRTIYLSSCQLSHWLLL